MTELRLALLISGGGTTAEAIINACREGRLSGVTPTCIISSSADSAGIERVRNAGIGLEDIVIIDPKSFSTPTHFGDAIISACRQRGVNFIGQYGWHWKTPSNVVKEFEGMMVNQHPGPLDTGRPDFGGPGMFGLRVHAARLYFVRKVNRDFFTEATTHRVTEEFDKGMVVRRNILEISPEDTPESLHEKLLPIEWQTQIEALQDFVGGTVEEYHRPQPLVRDGEEAILSEAKQQAKINYPNG